MDTIPLLSMTMRNSIFTGYWKGYGPLLRSRLSAEKLPAASADIVGEGPASVETSVELDYVPFSRDVRLGKSPTSPVTATASATNKYHYRNRHKHYLHSESFHTTLLWG